MEYRRIDGVGELVRITRQADTLRAVEREAVGPSIRAATE